MRRSILSTQCPYMSTLSIYVHNINICSKCKYMFTMYIHVHNVHMFEGDDSNSKSPEKIRFFYVFATTGLVLSPFRLILCMSSLKPMYRHFPSTPGPPKPHQPEIGSTSQVPILQIFQHVPTCSKMTQIWSSMFKYVTIWPGTLKIDNIFKKF